MILAKSYLVCYMFFLFNMKANALKDKKILRQNRVLLEEYDIKIHFIVNRHHKSPPIGNMINLKG